MLSACFGAFFFKKSGVYMSESPVRSLSVFGDKRPFIYIVKFLVPFGVGFA